MDSLESSTRSLNLSSQLCVRGSECTIASCPRQHPDDIAFDSQSDDERKLGYDGYRDETRRTQAPRWVPPSLSSQDFRKGPSSLLRMSRGGSQIINRSISRELSSERKSHQSEQVNSNRSQPATDQILRSSHSNSDTRSPVVSKLASGICPQNFHCSESKCALKHPKGMLLFQPQFHTLTSYFDIMGDSRVNHHSSKCRGVDKEYMKRLVTHATVKQGASAAHSVTFVPPDLPPDAADGPVEYCDLCDCCCHLFHVCSYFRQTKTSLRCIRTEQVKDVGKRNWKTLVNYYTSAFIAVYCREELSNQKSSFLPNSPPLQFLCVSEMRVFSNNIYPKQMNQLMLASLFPGGKRDYFEQDPIDCVMVNIEQTIAKLFELAGLRDIVQQAIRAQWENSEILAHIDRNQSQMTFFFQTSSTIMSSLRSSLNTFGNEIQRSPVNPLIHDVRGAVVMTEQQAISQLTQFRTAKARKNTAPAFFNPTDLFPSALEALDHLARQQQRTSNPHNL